MINISPRILGASGSSANAFSVHKNGTNQIGVTSNTWTKATWSTKLFDTNNNFDLSTNRFTPTIAETYLFVGSIRYASMSVGARMIVALYKNSTAYKYFSAHYYASASYWDVNYACSIQADANGTTDYFELFVHQNSGGDKDIDGAALTTYFMGSIL